jgi:hypothetical protein
MMAPMKDVSLATIGGGCAILTTATLVAGIALMAGSGVQVLIPESGRDGLDWIADVDAAGGAFFAGAWLVILGGFLHDPDTGRWTLSPRDAPG